MDAETYRQRRQNNKCTGATGCSRSPEDGTSLCKRHLKENRKRSRQGIARLRDRREAAGLWRSCGHPKRDGESCAVCAVARGGTIRKRPEKKDTQAEELPDGFVYFIQAGSGPIKIGSSLDPARRLNDLQTAHYEKLALLATVRVPSLSIMLVEGWLHEVFSGSRLQGEWFSPTESLVSLAAAMANGTGGELIQQALREAAANSTAPRMPFTL